MRHGYALSFHKVFRRLAVMYSCMQSSLPSLPFPLLPLLPSTSLLPILFPPSTSHSPATALALLHAQTHTPLFSPLFMCYSSHLVYTLICPQAPFDTPLPPPPSMLSPSSLHAVTLLPPRCHPPPSMLSPSSLPRTTRAQSRLCATKYT